MTGITILETVTRTAALGVRFWDRVTGRAPAEGLDVYETSTGTRARPTSSNVYVFHDLPGLARATFGGDAVADWSSPPISARFTFEVRDRDARFIAFRFDAQAPQRGLFVPPCITAGSPPSGAGCIPLFSAPSRPRQPGAAVVRADLWDAVADAPAAWAVLEISAAGVPPTRGVADALGRVVVQASYPEPRWSGASPPPGSTSLSDQTWTLEAAVRYTPSRSRLPSDEPEPPDLCHVLTQTTATVLPGDSPTSALLSETLMFGRELVLRSAGRSVLLVLPT